MRGRPKKVGADDIERVIGEMEAGKDIKSACKEAGIGRATLYRYLADHPITKGRVGMIRNKNESTLFR